MTPAGRKLGFSNFTLDRDGGRLLRGDEEVALRPKSFAVLEHLAAHAGRLVRRDELLSAVWPHTMVTDDSLTQCIGDIRKVLGENGVEVIRTVPRRGYVFSVPVTEAADPRVDIESSTRAQNGANRQDTRFASVGVRSGLAIAGVALLIAALVAWWMNQEALVPRQPVATRALPKSIAVLRFSDMSEGGDETYLADGLAEGILRALAESPELLVIARTSSFAIHGEDVGTAAAQLNVAHVLEGSVRRSGDRIRVTVQLVDAAEGIHLWSEIYERKLDDLFDLQTQIARDVAKALQVTLNGSTVQANQAPPDARAYERFLRGHFFYNRRASGDIERAYELYNEALTIDPGLASAWVDLAAIYNLQRQGLRGDQGEDASGLDIDGAKFRDLTQRERRAVEEALRLAPALPEAHIRAARYHWLNGELEAARDRIQLARTLDPDDPLVLGSVTSAHLWGNRLDAAIAASRRAVLRDPLGAVVRENLADLLLMAGLLEEAIVEYRNVLALGPALSAGAGRVDPPVFGIGRALLLQNRMDDALGWIEPWPVGPDRDYALAMVYHALGRTAEADAALERLRASTEAGDALPIAEVYAYREDFGAALASLHRIADHDGCRNRSILFAFHSPLLALMHADDRWQAWRTATEREMQECDSTRDSSPGNT
jgi:TolB-like protein/DNA-binding winged helix-turn-helix (wHTH) protein